MASVGLWPKCLTCYRHPPHYGLADIGQGAVRNPPGSRACTAGTHLASFARSLRPVSPPLANSDAAQARAIRLVGRSREQSQIHGFLDAVASGQARRVLVHGGAGAGKSTLLLYLRECVRERGGECGIGREEPIASPRPLGALGAALDEVAARLVARGGERLVRARAAVEAAVGANAEQLATLGPWLRCLLPENSANELHDGAVEGDRQADAVEQLIRAVAGAVGMLALCCDDLQRADAQTLQVLRKLGGEADSPLLMVEVFRLPTAAVDALVRERSHHGVVAVENLAPAAVAELLTHARGDFADDHLALSDLLWQRTGGNPFQLLTCIDLLQSEGAIRAPVAAGLPWRVALPRASALAATPDGVSLAARRLTAIDEGDRSVLATAARIGATFATGLLQELLVMSSDQLLASLRRAAGLGVVAQLAPDRPVDMWRFVHDRLHEAALELTGSAAGLELHAQIGRALWQRLATDAPALEVMAAVHQLNLGAGAERADLTDAQLCGANLRAAQAANSVGAFAAALDFADAGLRLTMHVAQDKHRDLVVEAASAARATAAARVPALVDRLMTVQPSPQQLASALALRANAVLEVYDTAGAMADIRKALALLGYRLPGQVGKPTLLLAVLRAQLALRGHTEQSLAALAPVRDPDRALLLHLLLRSSTAAYLSDAQLFAFLCCEMLRLGLAAGNCPATGYGLLVFGLVQAGALGRLDAGHRLGATALAMIDRHPDQGIHALSRGVWLATLHHLRAPLASTLLPLRQAFRAGLAEGDILQAGVCACFYTIHLLFSGTSVATVASEARRNLDDMRRRGQLVSHDTAAPFAALAQLLAGESDGFGLLDDRALRHTSSVAPAARFVCFSVHFCRCVLAVLQGNDRQAVAHASAAQRDFEGVAGTVLVPLYYYFTGIAVGRQFTARGGTSMRRLRRCHRELVARAALCPQDYDGRVALLGALISARSGDQTAALAQLDTSIALLTTAGFTHEVAVAQLTQAQLLHAAGAVELARGPRQAAARSWRSWGSAALAALAGDSAVAAKQHDSGVHAVAEVAMQGTEALAAVDTPDDLRAAFVRLTQAHLEAQRVLWLEARGGELRVRTEMQAGGVPRVLDVALDEFPALCRSAIAQAARTGEIVAEQDAQQSPTLASDPWVVQNGLRSLLALPTFLAGELVAVLVAEHSAREGVFTLAALSPMRVTSVAMAALLRNAELSADRERHAQALETANRSLDEQRQLLKTMVQERTSALDQAVRLQAAVLGALWEGVCGLDATGTVTFCNAAGEAMLGQVVVGKRFHDTFHRAARQSNSSVCPLCDATAPLQDYATTLHGADGREVHVECSLQPQSADTSDGVRVLSIRDVTRRRQLEQELRHTQKMEAIGRFVGGVAHEFNNLLTPIAGHVALAQADLASDHVLQQPLADVATATERAAALVRQLLTLGRRANLARQATELGDLAEQALRLLRPTLDRRIVIDNQAPSTPIWAEVNGDQIHQILLNLCLNARDALLSHHLDDAPMRIETNLRIVDVEPFGAANHPSRRKSRWVELSVRDNGPGIAPELHSRIFEPFFTTKPEGHGAGLGLGVVLGIVEQHGGWVTVESPPGQGTTVRCMFAPCDAPLTTQAPKKLRLSSTEGAGKLVLIIDDEPVVRRLGRAVLEKAGFGVLEASSGAAGLAELESNPAIDLVILDVIMPGLDGWQTLARLRMRARSLPVVMWTGYDDKADHQRSQVQLVTRLIKPFARGDLLAAVRTALRENVDDV